MLRPDLPDKYHGDSCSNDGLPAKSSSFSGLVVLIRSISIRSASLKRQVAVTTLSHARLRMVVVGLNCVRMASRSASNSALSISFTTNSCVKNPCVRAFNLTRRLPAAVFGPPEDLFLRNVRLSLVGESAGELCSSNFLMCPPGIGQQARSDAEDDLWMHRLAESLFGNRYLSSGCFQTRPTVFKFVPMS